jgi:hypothetical protein
MPFHSKEVTKAPPAARNPFRRGHAINCTNGEKFLTEKRLKKGLNYKNNQIMRPAPCALRPAPCALRPAPCALRPAPLYSITAGFSRAKRAKIQGLFAGLPPPVSIIPRLLPFPAFLSFNSKPLRADAASNFQTPNFNAAPDNGTAPPPNEG